MESSNEQAMKEATETYDALGAYAVEHGIVVSLVSIVEQECRLELLSGVSSKSGGNIIKVDPATLDKEFKGFLDERILATNVEV